MDGMVTAATAVAIGEFRTSPMLGALTKAVADAALEFGCISKDREVRVTRPMLASGEWIEARLPVNPTQPARNHSAPRSSMCGATPARHGSKQLPMRP